MRTYIYMVRHGESPKTHQNERTRGLTEKGVADAKKISELLKEEEIDVFVSSPFQRAILTLKDLAEQLGKEIIIYEDLKERLFMDTVKPISNQELMPLLEKSFDDPYYSLNGGESNAVCQSRAIKVIKEILNTYQGQKIAIGTHGLVMTLMMAYFDQQFDLNFLLNTSKPDVFKMEFEGDNLVTVSRMWN